MLHNIRSLHNVGSIFRTAEAAGVKTLYLTGITPAPIDRFGKLIPSFAKVSLGAEKTVVWEKVSSIVATARKVRKEGYKICAVEQSKHSIPFYTFKRKIGKTALILGNEVRGLPKGVLGLADHIIEIPMHGKKESLNVGVAAGIVIFGFLY